MRKTKIIATLGPATDAGADNPANGHSILHQLVAAGMDVARMNMSHQDADTHCRRADALVQVRRALERPVALLVDTRGPEIRIGPLSAPRPLTAGDDVTLTGTPRAADTAALSVTFPAFADEIPVGATILIDDGRLELQVRQKRGDAVICRVISGGLLRGGKGVCVPQVNFSLPFLSDRDRADLRLACAMGADMVAASFTRTADDLVQIRQELQKHGGGGMRVIAKIENQEGIRHLDDILAVADGVMIARGDLGMELPLEELPALQKTIIQKGRAAGVAVITATQMLDSMMTAPRPTRAEVCDVAGAIFDGTGAVMLSGETAAGEYPVAAVTTMDRIAVATERTMPYPAPLPPLTAQRDSITEAIAAAAVEAAHRLHAHAIVTLSQSGRAAHLLAKHRPPCPILCVTPDPLVQRQAMLTWGVVPLLAADPHPADPLQAALRTAEAAGFMPRDAYTVLVAASPFDAVQIRQNP